MLQKNLSPRALTVLAMVGLLLVGVGGWFWMRSPASADSPRPRPTLLKGVRFASVAVRCAPEQPAPILPTPPGKQAPPGPPPMRLSEVKEHLYLFPRGTSQELAQRTRASLQNGKIPLPDTRDGEFATTYADGKSLYDSNVQAGSLQLDVTLLPTRRDRVLVFVRLVASTDIRKEQPLPQLSGSTLSESVVFTSQSPQPVPQKDAVSEAKLRVQEITDRFIQAYQEQNQ